MSLKKSIEQEPFLVDRFFSLAEDLEEASDGEVDKINNQVISFIKAHFLTERAIKAQERRRMNGDYTNPTRIPNFLDGSWRRKYERSNDSYKELMIADLRNLLWDFGREGKDEYSSQERAVIKKAIKELGQIYISSNSDENGQTNLEI
jgi:hypothetical protein